MDADVIVVGAGNAGLSRGARRPRARRARARAGEGAARVVGRQLGVHRRRDAASPTAALEDVRDAASTTTPRLDATDLPPYTAEDFLADMRAGDARARRRRDGARAGRRLGATRSAGCAARGIRFRLMYERQAYEARRARHRFWGGLAVGAVDGGARADRPAPRGGGARTGSRSATRRRSRTLVDRRRRRARGPDGDARDAARPGGRAGRGRLRVQPARCARRYLGPELGRREGPRHAAQHRRGAAGRAAPRRRSRTGTGAAATRSSGTATRRPPATWSSPTASHASPIPSGSSSTPTASASSTRARTSATTPTRSTAPRCSPAARASPSRSSTPRSVPLLRDDRLRGAGRDARRRRHARASWPRRWGSTPSGFARTVREFNAAIVPGAFDPAVKDGLRTEGLAVAEVQLGAGDRHAAVRRVPGDVRDHVHVRRPARRRRRARAGPRRPPAPRAVRRGRARRRPVLPQLPGRQRADGGRGLRPPRGVRRRNYGIGRR